LIVSDFYSFVVVAVFSETMLVGTTKRVYAFMPIIVCLLFSETILVVSIIETRERFYADDCLSLVVLCDWKSVIIVHYNN